MTALVWPSQPLLRGKALGLNPIVNPALLSGCSASVLWIYLILVFLGLQVSAQLWPLHLLHRLLSNLHRITSISEANCILQNVTFPRPPNLPLLVSLCLLYWKHLMSLFPSYFQLPRHFPFPLPEGFLGVNDLAGLGNRYLKGPASSETRPLFFFFLHKINPVNTTMSYIQPCSHGEYAREWPVSAGGRQVWRELSIQGI